MTNEETIGLADYLDTHWTRDRNGSPSIMGDLKTLRDTVEQKLDTVHEGTTVHANYVMFLEELDRIIEYYQD